MILINLNWLVNLLKLDAMKDLIRILKSSQLETPSIALRVAAKGIPPANHSGSDQVGAADGTIVLQKKSVRSHTLDESSNKTEPKGDHHLRK
ncbi:unnamed protein product [Urochloa humidicola]